MMHQQMSKLMQKMKSAIDKIMYVEEEVIVGYVTIYRHPETGQEIRFETYYDKKDMPKE